MRRSVVAVVAGLLVLIGLTWLITSLEEVVLPGRAGHPLYTTVNLCLSALFAVLAGSITAAIAGRAELRHALALGVCLLIVGLAPMLRLDGEAPRWYALALMVIGPVGALAGAAWRARGAARLTA